MSKDRDEVRSFLLNRTERKLNKLRKIDPVKAGKFQEKLDNAKARHARGEFSWAKLLQIVITVLSLILDALDKS